MPNFDIVKNVDIQNTYRVSRVMADFDVCLEHLTTRLKGKLDLPEKWNCGLIVGSSGAGKSTIANELFSEHIKTFSYTHASVIDDMPRDVNVDEITKMFYAVGFGSTPCWLKPYSVLSTGERMRVDIANGLLSTDFFVFDEFTSVVDRNVAQTACIAIRKCLDRYRNKKFIGVSCHKDIIEYLQPDWVFDVDTMQTVFQSAHVRRNSMSSVAAIRARGQNLANIII